jgi:uncharacterized membrane protein
MGRVSVDLPPRLGRVALAFVLLVALDAVWFSLAGTLYPVSRRDVRMAYALMAWGALALALAAGRAPSVRAAAAYGAFVGLVVYAAFNGTEMALRPSWRKHTRVGVLDTTWGVALCATVGAAVHVTTS